MGDPVSARSISGQLIAPSQSDLRACLTREIISTLSSDGVFVSVSPSVEPILGLSRETFEGRTLEDICHAEDRDTIKDLLRAVQSDTDTKSAVYRVRTQNEEETWLETRIAQAPDGNLIAVSTDVSAFKRVEQALIRAREEAEAGSRSKSRFLASMSHELRTPLNAIIGFSDIISKEMFGPVGIPQYQEYADLIHQSGTTLLDLIMDILDMSKIEAGRYQLVLEDVDLGPLLAGLLSDAKAQADPKNLQIETHIPDQLNPIEADNRAIKQIIWNTVSNAVKFTPEGGTITISAHTDERQAVVVISDTGPGIPEVLIPHLDRPFEQIRENNAKLEQGPGLGLALIHALTRLHGGEVDIDTSPDSGTRVQITVPMKQAE